MLQCTTRVLRTEDLGPVELNPRVMTCMSRTILGFLSLLTFVWVR
ncbi:hypothetical protein XHC_0169 [Xanthomonas hortorum pv. carotae str. M081]|nr:hypothetical protein XHC_0169 [Xanthomonas hortorum pv. carotae str. M081]